MTPIEKAARALADAMGDDFDHAFASKADWIAERGESGGRFRDVNEPRQSDYLEGARAVLDSLVRNASEAMMRQGAVAGNWLPDMDEREQEAEAAAVFQAMIDAALNEAT